MFLLDVNVVVAANRVDHARHAVARPWFDRLLAGDEPFTVPTLIWASFLRLVTDRRIFSLPTPRTEAFGFIEDVHAQPHHLSLGPGPRHLRLLQDMCDEADAVGPLVTDAVIAAIAVEHGCTVATMDRDFARFRTVPHLLLAA